MSRRQGDDLHGGPGEEAPQIEAAELRAQASGNPLRVFYAFDPRRTAILLIGGDKTGNDRFYEEYVRVADNLYDEHLEELRGEGLIE